MKSKLGRIGGNPVNNNQKSKPLQLNVNPDELPDIECHKCKSKIFIPAQRIKRLSAILSPDGQERYVNIAVMICAMCSEELSQRP
jgi:DNA-directed RNA polymerase subunit RPC12/RpoP